MSQFLHMPCSNYLG